MNTVLHETGKNVRDGVYRQSNIEILRIISMIFILLFHVSMNYSENPAIAFLGSWSIVGVDCFIIITGFFIGGTNKAVAPKIFQLIKAIIFYDLLFTLIRFIYCCIIGQNGFAVLWNYIKEGLKQPLFCEHYWFITAYIFMLLISTVLNKISEKEILKLLAILSFIPICANFQQSYFNTVSNVSLFVYLYLSGWALRIYKDALSFKIGVLLLFFLTVVYSVCRWLVIINVFPSDGFIWYILGNFGRYSVIMALISLCLVFTASQIHISYCKTINFISSLMLGVYLFHSNTIFGMGFNAFKIINKYISNDYECFLFTSFILFAAGCIVEYIRENIFAKAKNHFIGH